MKSYPKGLILWCFGMTIALTTAHTQIGLFVGGIVVGSMFYYSNRGE